MKLTKQQKICSGFLVVGLIALTIDRMTGGGAAPVETADGAMPATSVLPASPTPAATAAVQVPAKRSLASRLDELTRADNAATGSFRDPFLVSHGWIAEQATAPVNPTAPFEKLHHLTAVIVSGKRSGAIIDGKLVTLGQTFAGHTLVAVTQDMAVLESSDARVLLRLQTAGGQAADIR